MSNIHMKRFGLFRVTDYYPAGGMSDFIAALETAEEAKLFASRSFISEYEVEDMFQYLSEPSPAMPSEQEYQAEIARIQAERASWGLDPINAATNKLLDSITKSMFGGAISPGSDRLDGLESLLNKKAVDTTPKA